MKQLFFFGILVFSTLTSIAQMDTIYINTNKIACNVKEVTQEAVKFVYPNEDIINTVYKNTVQRIVFKSGRVQSFAEATSYKTVKGAKDYDNVTFTFVQSEVNGLFKLGDVSSKAKGTTTLSSMEKVKERAYKKVKIVAAMMGANIVYLTQNNTSGNQMGGYFQSGKTTETNVAGVAYSNTLPSFDDFIKTIGSKTEFQCSQMYKMSQRDADYESDDYVKKVELIKVYNENGLIMMNAKIGEIENSVFRVVNFTSDKFTLMYKDGERIYNYVIII